MSKKKNWVDYPVAVDMRQSIIDMRKIYSNLDDKAFAKMYSRKYRLTLETVLGVISNKTMG